jgi:hypothetical protein
VVAYRKAISTMLVAVLFALGTWAQNTSPTPTQPDHDKSLKPSRYSAELPRGEFQDKQIEPAQIKSDGNCGKVVTRLLILKSRTPPTPTQQDRQRKQFT